MLNERQQFLQAVSEGNLLATTRLIESHGLLHGYHLLSLAVENNDVEMVKLLLSRGCPVTEESAVASETPLQLAVRNNNVEIVEILLHEGACVHRKNGDACSALAIAVRNRHLRIMNILLSNGAPVNGVEKDDVTPLHIACRKNYKYIVKQLLKCDANTNARTEKLNLTPLHLAVESASPDVVNLLLQNGAQVDCEDKNGRTALHIAVARGSLPVVQEVLKFHPDFHIESNRLCLETALRANGRDFNKIVLLLQDYGLTVSPESAEDPEIFHGALEKGNLVVLRDLLKHGADANAPRFDGFSPLHRAVMNGYEHVVKLLISYNAEVNARDSRGRTPIYYSIVNVDIKMMQILLRNGAKVRDFPELLHVAVRKNSLEIVKSLLLHGAHVNAEDDHGRTALHFTVLNEKEGRFHSGPNLITFSDVAFPANVELANLLLIEGADVDAQTETGVTTLHASVRKGLDSMVDLLLSFGANVALKDEDDATALHVSAVRGNSSICAKLLSKGAEINVKNKHEDTPLHLAACNGCEDVAKLLLSCGAAVDCRNGYGGTPLIMAAKLGQTRIIDTLLSAGANVNSRCKDGRSAIHFSSAFGDAKTVAALLEAGADINITWRNSPFLYTPLDCAWLNMWGNRFFLENYGFNGYGVATMAETLELLIQHQIKIRTAGLKVTEPVTPVLQDDKKFNDFHSKCQMEVMSLRKEFIKDTNVTYYDILRKDVRQLAMYMKNENIVLASEVEDYRKKFPLYASVIKCQFRKGLTRLKLLEPASQAVHRLVDLPEICAERVLEFLSDDDLSVLIDV